MYISIYVYTDEEEGCPQVMVSGLTAPSSEEIISILSYRLFSHCYSMHKDN